MEPDTSKLMRLRVRLGAGKYDTVVWDEDSGAVLPIKSVVIEAAVPRGSAFTSVTIRTLAAIEATVPNPIAPRREG